MERREFLRVAGAGVGAVAASSLFFDRLLAGGVPGAGPGLLGERFGLGADGVRKILDASLSKGGDFADIFFEHTISTGVTMEDEIVKESSEEVTRGAGIRVLRGSQTGYAYTSDLTPEALSKAALTAASIAAGGSGATAAKLTEAKSPGKVYNLDRPATEAQLSSKITLVKEAYAAALAHDKRIVKATAILGDSLQTVVIANSLGLLVSDVRPQVRLVVTATAEENGKRNSGNGNAGGRVGMAFYETEATPKSIGETAAKEALLLLTAADPEAGEQPVVLGRDQSGVLVHEAVGHPLEGDGAWKKTSIMWDKVGTMVASPLVTIYDDATIPFYRGSMAIDDEGTATRKVPLIEKGKLVGFLNDRLAARQLKAEPNGHGRRDSYRSLPIPRMNNTVLDRGETPPEEIIKSVKRGLYAQTYQGGQVQGTGKFTFSVNLGYLIEDGKLTKPVKNATLIGTNLQILQEVEMVGNDMGFFLGTCGKGGQWAAVTAGTPTLKIKKMTVGGRK